MSDINSIRVGQLPNSPFELTDKIPHEVGTDLKSGSIEDLAIFIANYASTVIGVGFRAISVSDGENLPTTDKEEFILVGAGTYYNVNGGNTIVLTQELNALISNGSFWTIGVEVPVNIEAAIVQTIRDGFTSTSPSENAIFDALLLKANLSDLNLINHNNLAGLNSGDFQHLTVAEKAAIASADANNVKLTGNQSIDGIKNFQTNTIFSQGFQAVKNSSITDANSPTNAVLTLTNSVSNTQPALVIEPNNSDAIRTFGKISILGAGNAVKFIATANGDLTSTSYIKSGATSTNLLLAGGTDITQASLPISTATQTALNGKVSGTGTTNFLPKFTASATIGNSSIFDNGNIGIGTNSPSILLQVAQNSITQPAAYIYNPNTTAGQSRGLYVEGGTDATDYSFVFAKANGGIIMQGDGNGKVDITGNVTAANGTALNHLITKAQTLYNNQTITTNKTVTIAEFTNNNHLVLRVDTTAGNVTITLPTFTALQGYKVTVKKSDSSANSVTITGVSGVNIDGASTLVISGQYSKATIGADLVQYIIL